MPTKDKTLILILISHQLQMLLLRPVLPNQQLLLLLKLLIHLTLTFHQKTLNTQKLQKNQRTKLLEKEKRLRSHTSGPPCNCTLLKCFERISTEERSHLLSRFNNDFANLNEQNAFLSSLILVLPRERPKPSQFPSKRRVFSYKYQVPVIREGIAVKVKVCHKAFMSIFGITNRRTQTIKLAVSTTGMHNIVSVKFFAHSDIFFCYIGFIFCHHPSCVIKIQHD